ncbi:MAG: hypothetical protein U9R60_11530 [Bacteroidota bacterium]|nr:hypothetical protein [Bacteroidota bacterium]
MIKWERMGALWYNDLRIIKLAKIINSDSLDKIISENNELIAIFVQSIKTAKRNMEQKSALGKGEGN